MLYKPPHTNLSSQRRKHKHKYSGKYKLTPEDFERLRRKWVTTLTGGRKVDLNVPDVHITIKALSNTAERYLEEMKPTSLQIWDDLSPIHKSVNFRKSFDRLKTIAQAYKIEGTTLSGDLHVAETVVQSLDFISREVYNLSTVVNPHENWWNYRIGSPMPLMDISFLLYDELGPLRRHSYGSTVIKFLGDINERSLKGANRADVCQALIGAAILTDNEDELARGRDGLSDVYGGGENSVFGQVETGEGFYEGGSYLSHAIYPYTGGYAVEHMVAMSKVVSVLRGSPYMVNQTELAVVYEAVEKTFVPVMFRGMIMGHVRGRNIARASEGDSYWGNLLLQALLFLSSSAEQPNKTRFLSLARSWWEGAPLREMGGLNVTQAIGIARVIEKGIPAAPVPVGLTVTPMSDRVMHHQPNWSAAVAMSSSRTGRYETINRENLAPYYQGDGFLHLYLDNDKGHYMNDYYPTMDPYHTPGVTNGQNEQHVLKFKSTAYNPWAGGVDWRGIGSASLDHFSADKGSSAKKSWFFLVNAIVALGAGCVGSSYSELHTTYESRNVAIPGLQLNIDGILSPTYAGRPLVQSNPKYAHLETVGGYLFLDSGPVTFKREQRKGRWTDIDLYPDYTHYDSPLSREYLTIYRNHGVDPTSASYAYAILPNITVEQTANQLVHPSFYVLENTATVQAITTNRNHTTMANFWSPGTVGEFHAETSCAAVWGHESAASRTYTVSLSDPTHLLDMMEVWITDPDVGQVIEQGEDCEILVDGIRGVRIIVTLDKRRGATRKVVFERVNWRVAVSDAGGEMEELN